VSEKAAVLEMILTVVGDSDVIRSLFTFYVIFCSGDPILRYGSLKAIMMQVVRQMERWDAACGLREGGNTVLPAGKMPRNVSLPDSALEHEAPRKHQQHGRLCNQII
jgi:hypothetical protein